MDDDGVVSWSYPCVYQQLCFKENKESRLRTQPVHSRCHVPLWNRLHEFVQSQNSSGPSAHLLAVLVGASGRQPTRWEVSSVGSGC